MEIPLVCSGRLSEFFPRIEKTIETLRLEQQVKFFGFVSPLEVQCLYRLSAGLVFPSEFEGWGQPVIEAFYSETPVVCSNVTSLPEVAGDAALLFDPYSQGEITEAVRRLWQDEAFRQRLITRGRERAKLFTWERTARIFRAHYRRLLGQKLTDEDQALLLDSTQPIDTFSTIQ
jgi:glycosyltransferase involved in cell wall biosynthesis